MKTQKVHFYYRLFLKNTTKTLKRQNLSNRCCPKPRMFLQTICQQSILGNNVLYLIFITALILLGPEDHRKSISEFGFRRQGERMVGLESGTDSGCNTLIHYFALSKNTGKFEQLSSLTLLLNIH